MYVAFTRESDAESGGLLGCLVSGARFILRSSAALDPSGGDIIDAVIVAMTVEINVREAIKTAPHARFEQPVPDDLRIPASISQISERTELPRETTRRRLESLASRGVCAKMPSGYIVPAAVLTGPGRIKVAVESVEAMRRLTADVVRRGLKIDTAPLGALMQAPIGPDSPIHAVNRAAATYAVDFLKETVRLTGGHESALIYLALLEAVRPGAAARHLSFLGIAQSLERPLESVRRRAMGLVDRGLAVRNDRGVRASWSFGESEDLRALCASNERLLIAMYVDICARLEQVNQTPPAQNGKS